MLIFTSYSVAHGLIIKAIDFCRSCKANSALSFTPKPREGSFKFSGQAKTLSFSNNEYPNISETAGRCKLEVILISKGTRTQTCNCVSGVKHEKVEEIIAAK